MVTAGWEVCAGRLASRIYGFFFLVVFMLLCMMGMGETISDQPVTTRLDFFFSFSFFTRCIMEQGWAGLGWQGKLGRCKFPLLLLHDAEKILQ